MLHKEPARRRTPSPIISAARPVTSPRSTRCVHGFGLGERADVGDERPHLAARHEVEGLEHFASA